VHDIGKNIVGVVLGCNNYEVIDLGVMVPCEKILAAAKDKKADIIGLSGLITPSLDEMVHVAKEMTREGFEVPLLIGGATTSKAHTAVKIAPSYAPAVIHVLDASRAVGVVGSLVSPTQKPGFIRQVRDDYERVRQTHQDRGVKPVIPIAQARANRLVTDWRALDIPSPAFLGIRVIGEQTPADLVPFIDWSPFFHTWELRGRFPTIFEDPTVGAKAKELYDDARRLLDEIIRKQWLRAKGVYGFFGAASAGDDIELYTDVSRKTVRTTIHHLRQQSPKPGGQPNLCLADYVAPRESGRHDYLGAFAVTAGIGLDELCKRFDKDHDDYNSIMAKALADRLAEAFAEFLHKQVREEWGYGKGEELTQEDLIRCRDNRRDTDLPRAIRLVRTIPRSA
jgi:Methionine synthase I, cobalamin-binding domain